MVRIRIRLTPRGGMDGIDGVVDGELHCRVAAPPADGAANEALVRLVARELELPRSVVQIVAGVTARRKVIGLPKASEATIHQRWPGLLD